MNNNSIEISRYLQQEMSDDEKIIFESRLASDKELQQELHAQRQIIKAAVNAGIKLEFAKAIRRKAIIKKSVTWGLLIAAGVIVILLFNFYNIFSNNSAGENKDSLAKQQEIIRNFINPPLPGINVPFSEYSFDAEKGETIFYPSGSIIHFPPSALVDESGNVIKGKVKITYREFADPADFFVSGIPMGYDSAGVKYNFESSGMCEINAYKDNKPVFVNKNARPEINLSGNNKNPLHNLYFLDTAKRSWTYMGKDIITEVKNISRSKQVLKIPGSVEMKITPVKPVEPVKAGNNPAFSIEIDPGSFEELFAYDGLKFEVVDLNTYKRSDADEHWQSVKLDHTSTEGIYTVTFTNAQRKVSYKVRPVLEGDDYDAALKVFKEKNKEYELAMQNRIVKDVAETDSITKENKKITDKINADNEWNIKMNGLIKQRNEWMRKVTAQQLDEQQRIIAANEQAMRDQFLRFQKEQEKIQLEKRVSAEIIRTFAINGFGIWNCDHPQYPAYEVPLAAGFTDSLNNKISLASIAVVYKEFNGITEFPSPQIRIIPGTETMLWAVKDSAFYYFSYKDFKEARIESGMRSFIFRMRRANKIITSYSELRELVENL